MKFFLVLCVFSVLFLSQPHCVDLAVLELSFTRLALNLQPSSCPCLPRVIHNSLISEKGLSPSSEMADGAVRPRKWVLWKKPGK